MSCIGNECSVEESLEKISKRIEANLCDAETMLRLGEIGGIVATLAQGVDSVRIDEKKMTEMKALKDFPLHDCTVCTSNRNHIVIL